MTTAPLAASVRHATPTDAAAITVLLAELGYPDTVDAVAGRIARATAGGPDTVLVSTLGGVVAAVASIHLIPLFHRDGFLARVTSFVVAEDLRHRGVGTALLGACERWAWTQRAERLEVTSGDERQDAHRFYERQGYARQGRRFSKWLHKPARE